MCEKIAWSIFMISIEKYSGSFPNAKEFKSCSLWLGDLQFLMGRIRRTVLGLRTSEDSKNFIFFVSFI